MTVAIPVAPLLLTIGEWLLDTPTVAAVRR